MISKLYRVLLRSIISNKYFWKYRHLIDKNIFKKTYGILPIKHFKKIFKKKIVSVLDFGCATGDKSEYFASRGAKYIYGIDINKKAINTCNEKFKNSKISYNFNVKLSEKQLSQFLRNNKLKKFDLAILDRVCYILNQKELYNILKLICQNCKYIYIDDFFYNKKSTKLKNNLFGYDHTNFKLLLQKFEFKKIFYGESPYPKPYKSIAKSAIFKSIK